MKRKPFAITNLFIFITTILAVIVVEVYGSRAGRLDDNGFPFWQNIVTFTVLSNIFLALTALITTIYIIVKKSPLPRPLATLYLSAAVSAFITFLTVVLYLAPARAVSGKNYFDMLLEPMFFLHFLNPVLGAITFIFFADFDVPLPVKSRLLTLLPFIVYAAAYILFVAILKLWPDFYGLTFGGRYYLTPLVFLGFLTLGFALATAFNFFHTKSLKK